MIKEKLAEEMKKAMKEKNFIRLDTIRLALAEIKNQEIEKRAPLGEEEVVRILNKEVKKREDSLEYFKKGNRPELIEKANLEISIIKEFLPVQLTIGEIDTLINEVLANSHEDRSFGLIMKEVMARVANRADGKLVSSLVKQKLSEG